MARRVRRLTPTLLRRMVLEEKSRFERTRRRRRIRETSDPVEAGIEDPEKVQADEVEPGDEAESIAKDIDWMRALKIQERKLTSKLRRIQETKRRLRARVVRRLS
tara:strand:- start:251 stop:565 length:315 start_codon:yes stop_codon:yes gene_type:complete